MPRDRRVHARGPGMASATSTRRRGHRRDHRAPQDARRRSRSRSATRRRCARRRRTGQPALLDPVAEPGDHRRQDRQRADHRDCDDHHRAEADADEALVAGEEHAGHGDHHRQAGDQHGPAGGVRRPLERRLRVVAGGPLLALAPHVEERVVDSDRHPDQQDDRRRPPRRPGRRGSGARPGRTWPATAERASSSGMPAATSEPNAISRITSVIGSDRISGLAEVVHRTRR